MNKQSIVLISHGHFEKDFLENIAKDVAHEFRYTVYIEESHIEISEFYNPSRRQYDGNKLLKEIDSISSSVGCLLVTTLRSLSMISMPSNP